MKLKVTDLLNFRLYLAGVQENHYQTEGGTARQFPSASGAVLIVIELRPTM